MRISRVILAVKSMAGANVSRWSPPMLSMSSQIAFFVSSVLARRVTAGCAVASGEVSTMCHSDFCRPDCVLFRILMVEWELRTCWSMGPGLLKERCMSETRMVSSHVMLGSNLRGKLSCGCCGWAVMVRCSGALILTSVESVVTQKHRSTFDGSDFLHLGQCFANVTAKPDVELLCTW